MNKYNPRNLIFYNYCLGLFNYSDAKTKGINSNK